MFRTFRFWEFSQNSWATNVWAAHEKSLSSMSMCRFFTLNFITFSSFTTSSIAFSSLVPSQHRFLFSEGESLIDIQLIGTTLKLFNMLSSFAKEVQGLQVRLQLQRLVWLQGRIWTQQSLWFRMKVLVWMFQVLFTRLQDLINSRVGRWMNMWRRTSAFRNANSTGPSSDSSQWFREGCY